jgi:hypothetical protein
MVAADDNPAWAITVCVRLDCHSGSLRVSVTSADLSVFKSAESKVTTKEMGSGLAQ